METGSPTKQLFYVVNSQNALINGLEEAKKDLFPWMGAYAILRKTYLLGVITLR